VKFVGVRWHLFVLCFGGVLLMTDPAGDGLCWLAFHLQGSIRLNH
jgi:hypothetical protein